MSNLPDLDAFDRGQIAGINKNSIDSERLHLISDFCMNMKDDRACKQTFGGQQSSQQRQTLAQITTQLNDGTSRTVSKRTVPRSLHRMGFGSC
ncbi:hypothetical protein TNCV_12981 [Trichonephila clavipes]|nr:hypothetical protein TNCV_12981 [Trichonephila clavipes]